MSSSSAYYYEGQLTTIFTPPSDCFTSLPGSWTSCIPWNEGTPICYWSIPASCFPTGGVTATATLGHNDGFYYGTSRPVGLISPPSVVTQDIRFSPGVLPYMFYTAYSSYMNIGYGPATSVIGCLKDWTTYDALYCTSDVTAQYTLQSGIQSSGPISAVMPQIAILWAKSDLSRFMPASAPVLPTSTPAHPPYYEHFVSTSKAAAKSRSSHAIAAATSVQSTQNLPSSLNLQIVTPTSPARGAKAGTHNLSSGAEAGIGVGVAVALIACIVVAFMLLRRRRRGSADLRVETHDAGGMYRDNGPSESDGTAMNDLKGAKSPALEGKAPKAPRMSFLSKSRSSALNGSDLDDGFYST